MTLESNPTSPRPELGGATYYSFDGRSVKFRRYVEHVRGKILLAFNSGICTFTMQPPASGLTVPVVPSARSNAGARSIADARRK
jgi:hypothetical protein